MLTFCYRCCSCWCDSWHQSCLVAVSVSVAVSVAVAVATTAVAATTALAVTAAAVITACADSSLSICNVLTQSISKAVEIV